MAIYNGFTLTYPTLPSGCIITSINLTVFKDNVSVGVFTGAWGSSISGTGISGTITKPSLDDVILAGTIRLLYTFTTSGGCSIGAKQFEIALPKCASGPIVNPPQPTLVANPDGTYTYTPVSGTPTIISDVVTTLVDNLNGTYTYTNELGDTTTISVQCPIDTSGVISAPFRIYTESNTDPCRFKSIDFPCENLESKKSSINAIVPVSGSTDQYQVGIVNEYLRAIGADEFDLRTDTMLNDYEVFVVESDTAINYLPDSLDACRSNVIQIDLSALVSTSGVPYAYGVDLPNVDIIGRLYNGAINTSLKAVLGRNLRAGEVFKFRYEPNSQRYTITT